MPRAKFDRVCSSKDLNAVGALPDEDVINYLRPNQRRDGKNVILYNGTGLFAGIELLAATVAYPHTDHSHSSWVCIIPLQSAHSFGTARHPNSQRWMSQYASPMSPVVFDDSSPHWLLRVAENEREWYHNTVRQSNVFVGAIIQGYKTEAKANSACRDLYTRICSILKHNAPSFRREYVIDP